VTTAVQIQNYKGVDKDRNPYNHTPQDTFEYINQDYFFEQVKATTAIAGHLLGPINQVRRLILPYLRANKR
jgi:hypothetical protein